MNIKEIWCSFVERAQQYSCRGFNKVPHALPFGASLETRLLLLGWLLYNPVLNVVSLLFVAGDSFVVNACLARKGLDDWLVKQKYYCSGARLEQQDCPQKSSCGTSVRVRDLRACLVLCSMHAPKTHAFTFLIFAFAWFVPRFLGACVRAWPPRTSRASHCGGNLSPSCGNVSCYAVFELNLSLFLTK